MALDHDGAVGDFRRSGLRKVFEEYRSVIQKAAAATPDTDEITKKEFKKRLARLEELEKQWLYAWVQLSVGQASLPKEQEERENALLRIEAQLAKDCPHIFRLSYYVPVRTTIPDTMKI